MLSITGHLGDKVAALVDGQLPPAVEERAWSHVHACPGCRRLVEHEAWTKRRLERLAVGGPHPAERATAYPGVPAGETPGARGPGQPMPPTSLLESLQAVDDWAAASYDEGRGGHRRVTIVAGGAVAASVLGLVAVTGGAVVRGDLPAEPSPASIRGEQPQQPQERSGGLVGTPLGGETNAAAVWTRRSR